MECTGAREGEEEEVARALATAGMREASDAPRRAREAWDRMMHWLRAVYQ